MSTTYKTITGDTFANISRKVYGTELETDRIIKANPGAAEPLSAGITLIVPVIPDAPTNTSQSADANNPDELAILVDGNRFRFWNSASVTRSIDSMDKIEFGAPFDVNIAGFKNTFKPLAYKNITITVGGNVLFTGTGIGVNPVVETGQKVVSVSGYSLPGVLNDCTASGSAYPVEFNGQGLSDIADTLAKPFSVSSQFDADAGAIFDSVTIETDKKVLDFLIGLARQRKLIISSTETGRLLFQQSVASGKPVARLVQGVAPVLSITPTFKPQQFYSHITGIEPVTTGSDGSQFTVKNTRLDGVVRPLVFKVKDTSSADLPAAVNSKMGFMFADAITYSIAVATWRDSFGELWKPNTTLMLTAPDAMVYKEYEFIIKSVKFNQESNKRTAIINLVVPGSYSGEMPGGLPWDE